MDISWDDIRLFLAVAETGSLSAAARRLRVGQPTVSRRLADLEHQLGDALFRRSVEGASLTDAGARLLEPARRMAEWAGEVGRASEGGGQGPQGRVRVSAAPFVAADLLAPLAAELRQTHPGLRLEISAAIQLAELGRGEADLALRNRPAEHADLVTVASLAHGVAIWVSPALRDRLGPRPSPAEVPWITWCPPFEAVPPNPQLAAMVPDFTPALSADDFLVMLAAAERGAGAIALPTARHRLSARRNLVPLDLDLGPHARGGLHLVCARSALAIPRVRVVAGILERLLLEATPWEEAEEAEVAGAR